MVKCKKKETNKEANKTSITKYFHKAGKPDFEQISFLGYDIAEVLFDVEIYSACITLFGIYYQNQGTNQITVTQGPLPVINSQLRRGKCPRLNDGIVH